MYFAAVIVDNPAAVIEHKLYWAAADSLDEARYLVAVLNSGTLRRFVQTLQGRGEHNPRDFDKYVWQAPIPLHNSADPLHRALSLAEIRHRYPDLAPLTEGIVWEACSASTIPHMRLRDVLSAPHTCK